VRVFVAVLGGLFGFNRGSDSPIPGAHGARDMHWRLALLVLCSALGALGLGPGGSHGAQAPLHLHCVFSNAYARDLTTAWRLRDPRSDLAVHYTYCSARVLLSNPLAFVIAGWSDAGGTGAQVSLFLCMDHGDTHRLQVCLWAEAATDRASALRALEGWHCATMGPRGPTLVLPRGPLAGWHR